MTVVAFPNPKPKRAPLTVHGHARLIRTGFVFRYRTGERNYCPACEGTSWHVGRITVTCANCDCALPL